MDSKLISAGVVGLACLAIAACGDDDGRGPAAPVADGDSRIGAPVLSTNDPALGAPEPEPDGPPSVSTGAPPQGELDELPPAVGVGSKRAACRGGTAALAATNERLVKSAILCLLNAERTSRGLRALRSNARLARAAAGHSGDMVRRKYFAHDSPSGRDLVDRVRRTGFIPRSGRWAVGENIAFGSGSLGQPAAIMRAWMESPGHRANILQRRFKEIGIGVARGLPVGGVSGGATYTTDFGAIE